MGRNKKVCCNICLRVMRSDTLNRHLKVHERREETSKPHHQFYNYNIFKNIKLYKEKTTMGKNKKEDIWACYNCNRWETDERCQICSAENICSNEDMNEDDKENDISDVRGVNGNFIIHKTCCRRMANGVSKYKSTVTGESYV